MCQLSTFIISMETDPSPQPQRSKPDQNICRKVSANVQDPQVERQTGRRLKEGGGCLMQKAGLYFQSAQKKRRQRRSEGFCLQTISNAPGGCSSHESIHTLHVHVSWRHQTWTKSPLILSNREPVLQPAGPRRTCPSWFVSSIALRSCGGSDGLEMKASLHLWG